LRVRKSEHRGILLCVKLPRHSTFSVSAALLVTVNGAKWSR